MGLFRSHKLRDESPVAASAAPSEPKRESRWRRHKKQQADDGEDEIVELVRPRDTVVTRISTSPTGSPSNQRRRRSA
jgi:hypothetical protein